MPSTFKIETDADVQDPLPIVSPPALSFEYKLHNKLKVFPTCK